MNLIRPINRIMPIIIVVSIALLLCLAFTNAAYADSKTIPTIGGDNGTGTVEDINDTIESIIFKIRIVGALIVVACIIIGFIIVGMSLGNAQKRAIGISAVLFAGISIYGIAKAPAIANYIIQDSQKTSSEVSVQYAVPQEASKINYHL
ncbi:hypothetical protein PV433_33680 [Paenibacillus sp. GYB004]|uniref:hypothetical protein n=1 Tax=Paenibacillus sp. GYB004 TaxID=2994393 RepID=UPI002F9672C5